MCSKPIKIKANNIKCKGNILVSNLAQPVFKNLFVPEAMTTMNNDIAIIMVKNCDTHELIIPGKTEICEIEQLNMEDVTINVSMVVPTTDTPLPAPLSSDDQSKFMERIKLNVPQVHAKAYVSLFSRNYDIFSKNKEDLGRANNFKHNIKLHNNLPVYRKPQTILYS